MDQNFTLMAQSRANYYTAGSPVQFVRVELLKGDMTGEVAVCLTFKNVGTEPLTGLVVHFKCKDAAGQVLCEDDFYYEQLNAQSGAVFGSDDAVYVSDTPVSSVEVEQDRAFLNGRGVDLRSYKRVRLNLPRVLPGSIAKTLQQRTGNAQLTCVPQDNEYGWFCACGAFHPNEDNTTVCAVMPPRAVCLTMRTTMMRAPRCSILMILIMAMMTITRIAKSPRSAAATPMTTRPARTMSWQSASFVWHRLSRPSPAH